MSVHEEDSTRKLSFCLSFLFFFPVSLQLVCNSNTSAISAISIVIVKAERS